MVRKNNIMGSISEREVPKDIISNLPNNVISYFLSFLSTEDAVRTSTLSRQWINKWTLTTRLDIDDGLLILENSRLIKNPNPRRRKGFVNFVYRVLLYRVTALESFRLRCGEDYGVFNVRQWISAALSRNVRVIDLWAPLSGCRLNHQRLFANRRLVVLNLGIGFLLKVPENISLVSLRTLHLHNLAFKDSESLSRLVSSCPVLGELKIEGILWDRFDVLNISSPVLESLIILGLFFHLDSEIEGPRTFLVILNTPNLRYFKHEDEGVPRGYHIQSTLPYLDEAWLCLVLSNIQIDAYEDDLIIARSLADLAVAISNVRVLYMSKYTFEAFYHPGDKLPNFQLPIFPRLTKLDIGDINEDVGLSLLTKFLQSSPQLTSLSFALGEELKLELWNPPTGVPSCMLYNLKVIEVVFNLDPEPMLSMVKYILEKTNCLAELRISLKKEKNEEFIKRVSLLPRASNLCKILLT